jgi:hypothetical protein
MRVNTQQEQEPKTPAFWYLSEILAEILAKILMNPKY